MEMCRKDRKNEENGKKSVINYKKNAVLNVNRIYWRMRKKLGFILAQIKYEIANYVCEEKIGFIS